MACTSRSSPSCTAGSFSDEPALYTDAVGLLKQWTLVRRQAGGPVELPSDKGQNTNPAVTLRGQLKLLLTTLGKVDTDL
jgi:hypothetical protein